MQILTDHSYLVILGFLLVAALFDIKTRRVPNYLVGVAVGMALIFVLIPGSQITFMKSLLGGLLGLFIFFYPFTKSYLGAADTKLLILVGIFLGPHLAIWAYLFTCLIGGFFATFMAIYQSQMKQSIINIFHLRHGEMNFPYAVAIFVGTVMAIFKVQNLL
jgi:prepilin peptidase CpaA